MASQAIGPPARIHSAVNFAFKVEFTSRSITLPTMVFRPTRGDAPLRIGPGVSPVHPPETHELSADVYRDPMRYELEVENVLRKSWLIAGRSEEIAGPGDWITYEGHGDTIVVSRLADGGVAAFHNVCQHRGARLTRGATSGCDRRFTCPWHGWVYDQTGDIVGVPERQDFSEESLEGLRSPKVCGRGMGRLGVDQSRWPRRRTPAARLDRFGDHHRPWPVQDGEHAAPRKDRGRPRCELQGRGRRVQRGVPRVRVAPHRPRVRQVGEGHGVSPERSPRHDVRAPSRQPRQAHGHGRPPPLHDLSLRGLPHIGVQQQPGPDPAVPVDPARPRAHAVHHLGADLRPPRTARATSPMPSTTTAR